MENARPSGLDSEPAVIEDPTPADIAELEDSIHAFNVERTGIDDGTLLAIVLRDADGTLQAGLHGHTWGGCCEVKVLWIARAHRGRGLGTQMLQAVEREARARGCSRMVLASHSFQAPEFYEKRGFRRIADIAGYPAGHSQVVLLKVLDD